MWIKGSGLRRSLARTNDGLRVTGGSIIGRIVLGPALALALLLAAACSDSDDEATDGGSATPAQPTATGGEQTPSGTVTACDINLIASLPAADLTWEQLLPDEVPAPAGWSVEKGEGEGPFLDVSVGSAHLGTIELLQFPLEEGFDSADGVASLRAWAEEYYDGVEADRTGSYGESYTFEGVEPTPVTFGAMCAVLYGFEGTQDGEVLDRVAGYATFSGGRLFLAVASYDAGNASEGIGWLDPEKLAEYEQSFDDLMRALEMPPE